MLSSLSIVYFLSEMLTKYITFTGFNYIFNIFFFFYEKGTFKEVENETINKEILEIRKQVLTT